MPRSIKLAVLLCFTFLFANAQRDTIKINNNWRFTIDKNAKGNADKWFLNTLPNSKAVTVPHTWNVEEENQHHYGWGWYQRKINIPANWKKKQVTLQFGAINHTSYIYLNGKKIAENIGDGFTKFYVTLNDNVVYGKENVLTVAVNNDYGQNKVPFGSSFDWANDGGLIRPVALIVSDKPAASYIKAVPTLDIAKNSGHLKLAIGMASPDAKNIQLNVTVTEENQPTKNVVLQKTLKPVWINGEAVVEYDFAKVNAWHFDAPNLYKVDVKILNGKKATDKISTQIGFREVKFKNGQTFLNGERIKLMGVEWTAGSNPKYGFAEPDTFIVKMGKLMKDVNAIFTRQHFQQSDVFYDFCDRNGMLVQQEVPLWGPETPANETIKNISIRQMEAMVRNFYNHPSVFSWGVGNELRGRDKDMKAMILALIAKARSLDPTRHVAYVSNTITESFSDSPNFVPDAANDGDYLMMNEYGGSWWGIPTGDMHNYLDRVHKSYPDKPFFISEFGLCEPNFKGGDVRRLEDLIYHMAVYETKPYIEGAIYFDLTDYRTHYPGTSDKGMMRRRVHGIYDMYGNAKPSMRVLREMSSPIDLQRANAAAKGKLNVLMFGAIGLPQHTAKGYKLYLSDRTDNYLQTKAYNLPDIKPGQRLNFEVEDLYKGEGIVTIVRPNGYVVTQKSFYWTEKDQ